MEVYEIAGWATGVSKAGVNFLQPKDSFQQIKNGFIYRQVLQSRLGFAKFGARTANHERILGIFEYVSSPDSIFLLVFDTTNCYKFTAGTNTYDIIPFAGALAGYAGFGLTNKDDYISGDVYQDKNGTSRFVFSSKNMSLSAANSGIFFINSDATQVLDYCTDADNPGYKAPPAGELNTAGYVYQFNGRLNFGVPKISNITYNQSILFSGIKDSSGTGDKYNVAGSGSVVLDTGQFITGLNILGNVFAVNCNRSGWIIEKTTDAFNPYFSRKIPSDYGTNANYSGVEYFENLFSVGKTGLIVQNRNDIKRFDNKIPYFTENEINQLYFNYTYGGFDRKTNQFYWSYVDGFGTSTTQDKVLVYNYEEQTFSIYDQRFSVFGETDAGFNLTWNQIDETYDSSWARWDTTENIWNEIGLSEAVQKTLAGDDLGYIYELDQDGDDYKAQISNISNANPCVITFEETAFQNGDEVVIENVEGMLSPTGESINNFDPEIPNYNFTPYTLSNVTDTTAEINLDTTNYTAVTPSTGRVSKVINFEALTIPLNPFREQGLRCYLSHIEFLIATDGGILKVDLLEDEEGDPYKSDIILYPTNFEKDREWITIIADQEANFHTIRMKQQSPATILKIYSIRLHMKPGGYTYG